MSSTGTLPLRGRVDHWSSGTTEVRASPATVHTLTGMTQTAAATPAHAEVETFRRFLEGSDAAFHELYTRYDRRLRTYCLKVMGTMATAEDIVQELWERVIRMRVEPVEIQEPGRYFLRMARNSCLKRLERERRVESLDTLDEWEHPTEQSHEPSHLEELVKMAVEQLPLDQREVIVLHNYLGHPYEDIAAMREENVGAVKMRAMRARGKIGKMIEAYLALERPSEDTQQR